MAFRRELPLLQSLPWLTGTVLGKDLDVYPEREPLVHGLVQAVEQQEQALYRGYSSTACYEVLLDSASPSRMKEWGKGLVSKAVWNVLLYKLLDLVTWIKYDEPVQVTIARGIVPTIELPDWSRLTHNWHAFIRDASNLAHSLLGVEGVVASPDVSVSSQHFFDLCRRNTKLRTNKFAVNVHVAAIYLGCLLKGQHDMPESLSQLAADQGCSVSDMEMLGKRHGMQGMRLPLQLALAISPCVLFLNTQLHNQSVDRMVLLQSWEGLGGHRPVSLLRIERVLWEAMFNIARGAHLLGTMKQALQLVDVILESAEPTEDFRFFASTSELAPEQGSMSIDSSAGGALLSGSGDRSDVKMVSHTEGNMEVDEMDRIQLLLTGAEAGGSFDEDPVQDPVHVPRRSKRDRQVTSPVKPLSKQAPYRRRPALDGFGAGTKYMPIDLTSHRFIGGNIIEVIDLTTDHDNTFELTLSSAFTDEPKLCGQRTLELYDVQGVISKYRPRMHRQADVEWVYAVHQRVSRHYVDERPLHIADPERSVFHVVKQSEFDAMTHGDVLAVFGKKHILVHGISHLGIKFDQRGLETLASAQKIFTVQDMSIDVKPSQQTERTKDAMIHHLIEAHNSKYGKILNALDFPLPYAPLPPDSIASDVVAFRRTTGKVGCDQEFPSASTRWGLAAISGAYHGLHIDCDGLGTYIDCLTGSKWWVVARPADGDDFSAFARMKDVFTFVDKEGDSMAEYVLEAVLLKPGTRLYMRPNTPHCVLTPEAAICHGGHFYASSTIRDSCYGFLNSFVASSLITNTEHTSDAQLLQRRLLEYLYYNYVKYTNGGPVVKNKAHVPDIGTFDGLLDVLSLCNIVEASNILHHKTYTPTGIPADERRYMIHARVRAREILLWVFGNYQLDGNHSLRKFYWDYLAYQLRALCRAKTHAEKIHIFSSNGESIAKEVDLAIKRAFVGVGEFWASWDALPDNLDIVTWAWKEKYKVTVQRADQSSLVDLNFSRPPGYTSDDAKWAPPDGGEGSDMDVDGDSEGGNDDASDMDVRSDAHEVVDDLGRGEPGLGHRRKRRKIGPSR